MLPNRTAILLVGILTTLSAGASAAAHNPAAATVKLMKGDRIIFFGDSFTDQARGPKGYVGLVRAALKEKHPDLGIEVEPVATGGHRVTDLLRRVDRDV